MSEYWEKLIAGADVMGGDVGYEIGTQEKYEAFVKVRNKSLGQARMRDLVQQAKANQPYECSYTKDDWLKTFAELIVRECAEVAGCNGHVSGFALGDLIKQHFGVEE